MIRDRVTSVLESDHQPHTKGPNLLHTLNTEFPSLSHPPPNERMAFLREAVREQMNATSEQEFVYSNRKYMRRTRRHIAFRSGHE